MLAHAFTTIMLVHMLHRFSVIFFIATKRIETVPHLPYSPDLDPNDLVLYPTTKKMLKGRHFPKSAEAVKALEAVLKNISKNGFQKVFKEWQRCCKICIALNGGYIELEKV